MKQKLITFILIIVAVVTVSAPFIHGSSPDISLFHGFIIHPVFLLSGLALFAFVIGKFISYKCKNPSAHRKQ